MGLEDGKGSETLGAEVREKFNKEAGAFMGKAMGKGERMGRIGDTILKELSAAVKEGDGAGQTQMEGALTNFAQSIGGETEASNMIGFLHPEQKDK